MHVDASAAAGAARGQVKPSARREVVSDDPALEVETNPESEPRPHCIVMLRNPVDRFISMFYQRVAGDNQTHAVGDGRMLNDWSADELQATIDS